MGKYLPIKLYKEKINMKKIAFIGENKIANPQHIKKKLTKIIEKEINNGSTYFVSVLNGDFDMLAVSICTAFKQKIKEIDIEVVFENFNEFKDFDEKQKLKNFSLSKYVSAVFYTLDFSNNQNSPLLTYIKMLDSSDMLICYINKKHNSSDIAYALSYAKILDLKVVNLF